MRIRWTPPAVADMQSISDYLQEHHPQYRQPTMRKLYERIRSLKDTPEGKRELFFPPMFYVGVYRVKGQTIEIWRIYHAAQNRP